MTQVYRTHRCTCIGCGDTFYSALDLEQHCDHRSHHQCNKCYTRFPVSYYLQEHSHTCSATSFTSSRGQLSSAATDDTIMRRNNGGSASSSLINDDLFMESSSVRPNRGKINRNIIQAMRRSGGVIGSGIGSSGRLPSFQPASNHLQHNATPTTIATRDGISLMNHTPIRMTIPSVTTTATTPTPATSVAAGAPSSSTSSKATSSSQQGNNQKNETPSQGNDGNNSDDDNDNDNDDTSSILLPPPSGSSGPSSSTVGAPRVSSRPLGALPLVRSGITRRPTGLKTGAREQQTRMKFTSNML